MRSAFVLIGLCIFSSSLFAGPRALPEGSFPNDVRLAPPKDLNGYFPFVAPATRTAWEERKDVLRRQILVSQGLWPMPTKTPLNAVIHGRIDRGDYTVEKVYFESMPGFFVAGSLYRPKNVSGPRPGVLSPHGHWSNGRFHDAGEAAVRKEIVKGAERFEEGGRSPLQSRQVQLARMGCIAFHYDMLGYADSTQLSFELVHRFAKQRPELNTPENWGLYSPQAESHLQSVMGLQTWNSIRALDFLLSLPDVDASRIAVSGASGGGTQTFLLAAIDDRVKLAFPAVMVSTAMQGGCTCENSSCLRIGTGNVEFAGMFGPKPLGMTAADDWTKEMTTKGFPELKSLYAMLEAPKNVELFSSTHFGHNYNYVSRSSFYSFLNKHFQLGVAEPVIEQDYKRLTQAEISVWDEQHPQPSGGVEFEKKLLKHWHDDAQSQLDKLRPTDASSLAAWRDVVGKGAATVVGRSLPTANDVVFTKTNETDAGDYVGVIGLLRNQKHGEELPAVILNPKKGTKRIVVWLSEHGKSGLFAADDAPTPAVKKLLDGGASVVGVDLLFQGEFLNANDSAPKNRSVKNTREFAGFTYGYNSSLLARRSHDVLTTLAYCRNQVEQSPEISVVAFDGVGPIAAVALSQAEGCVSKAAIDTRGFRFIHLKDYLDKDFLPGGAKYGDLHGFLALAAPTKLRLQGEPGDSIVLDLVRRVYSAAGKPENLQIADKEAKDPTTAAAWILE